MEDLIQSLEDYNYWKKAPSELGMVKRDLYLKSLLKSCDNNLIKVLIGQRRTGKSYILKQFISALINKEKVNPENILYVNFELTAFQDIDDKKKLSKLIDIYLKERKIKKKSPVYFIFDEIQEVSGWEKVLSSLIADKNYPKEIYITGSNSKLLSSELATYITGRYINIKVYPLSFQEYLNYHDKRASKDIFLKYLLDSQLPELLKIKDEQIRFNYINSIKDSIILKDIVVRYRVQNIALLEKIFLFIIDNLSNLFSINSLVNKLNSQGYSTNAHTLGDYIKYLEEAMIITGVSRYDLKGKKILEGEKKYYLTDLGFRHYLFSDFDSGIGKLLENYIFNYLKLSGYEVYVGKLDQYEIDFIVTKGKEKKYIQVSYLLYGEEVIAREYGNLERIKDNWEKIVISLDDVKLPPRNGIRHLQAWDLGLNTNNF
jgi:predicted AAA+ superfamily ATPase